MDVVVARIASKADNRAVSQTGREGALMVAETTKSEVSVIVARGYKSATGEAALVLVMEESVEGRLRAVMSR